MAISTRPSSSAIAYARALLALSDERSRTPEVANDLEGIRQSLLESPETRQFFASPAVKHEERDGLIDRVIRPRVQPLVGDFIRLLSAKGKLALLGEICEAFDQLLDERLGKVEVDVTVASRLDSQQLESVRQRVSQAIRRDAVVHQYVDESIIGGIIIRVGDQVIDGSLRAQLDAVKAKLLAVR
jgi:F-type H+-transporting ATPase subunit delta